MARARFSIGIDLGTTNCALSQVPLDPGGQPEGEAPASEVFAIAQWERPGVRAEASTLPSFLYLPTAGEADSLGGGSWVPGRFARQQSVEAPGRVVHSAKSWLCHHLVDRSAKFLPWDSDVLGRAERISPIEASAVLLRYLRSVWDAGSAGDRFDDQLVTVTVPASFDPVAQRLTLEAAGLAGFPEKNLRLLEEPQAAFYRWLESASTEDVVLGKVLVVDIGGGTSDFSLFDVGEAAPLPRIRRVAVSEHLLLGGDNIDLTLAHRLMERLGTELSPGQWSDLVGRCRELKERCLGGEAGEEMTVSIAGRGSGLFAGALTARIGRDEIESLVNDGFFPECPADAEPGEEEGALGELALPYAADSAVTRHLARFLRGRPPVDAVLFNGGSLKPAALRHRLLRQIGAWQGGRVPVELENPEPDLAVARGAARYGAVSGAARIEAGAPRSVYLEVEGKGAGRQLLCILPQGAEPGDGFMARVRGLELTVGRKVRFRSYDSTRRPRDRSGSLVPWDAREFHPLPPLETEVRLAAGGAVDRVPVTLSARLNELGLLRVDCLGEDGAQAWPLEFDLRPRETAAPEPVAEDHAAVDPELVEAASRCLAGFFAGGSEGRKKLTANRLFGELEEAVGEPRHEWSGMLLRALWPALADCAEARAKSPDHEEAWLIAAGYLLRPGFGAARDAGRIDELWRICGAGPANSGKRIALQRYILWRRVAGGLDRERQEAVLLPALPKLDGKKAPAELVRMAGAFEHLPSERKAELAARFTDRAVTLAQGGGYPAPWLVATGLLLNRAPLYAGPASVPAPGEVERAWDKLHGLDWGDAALAEVHALFLRAARVVDDPGRDLPAERRQSIAAKLEEAGVPALKVEPVRHYLAVDSADRAGLFGEALPAGLSFGG